MPHADNVEHLIREIGLAFHRLKAIEGAILADLGVTAAMAGVLEALDERGPATVPQVARARKVTRQHIQGLVDALWERGLCRFSANPAHARSPVIELTPKGHALFETLRQCERPLLAELAAELPADVTTAVAVMRRLNAALHRRLPAQEAEL
jgi:DNA-binding MarR family transcriptional regulator